MFILIGAAASAGLDVPKTLSAIGAFCLAVSWACFLAFRSEKRKRESAERQLTDRDKEEQERQSLVECAAFSEEYGVCGGRA